MRDVVELSQYKTRIQLRKVNQSTLAVVESKAAWEEIKQQQEDYTQWQLAETQRLFDALAAKPATTEQLKTYNSTLATFKHTLLSLNKNLSIAESEYSRDRDQLTQEKQQLHQLQNKQEKFEYVSHQLDDIVANQRRQKEEEQAMDDHSSISQTITFISKER